MLYHISTKIMHVHVHYVSLSYHYSCSALCMCKILTSDPAVDQGTGASGRRYQGITLAVDGLNWVQMWSPQEQVGVKQLYNLGPQTSSVSLESVVAVRGSENQHSAEGWILKAPSWAAQQNEKEVLLKTEELGVNMLLSLFSLQLTSHT